MSHCRPLSPRASLGGPCRLDYFSDCPAPLRANVLCGAPPHDSSHAPHQPSLVPRAHPASLHHPSPSSHCTKRLAVLLLRAFTETWQNGRERCSGEAYHNYSLFLHSAGGSRPERGASSPPTLSRRLLLTVCARQRLGLASHGG